MKRVFALVLFALILLTACGKEEPTPKIYFAVPADVVQIDMSVSDPSNEKMRFAYDVQGRVEGCYYMLDGHEIYVNYSYTSDSVKIIAFSDDVVAAEKTITLNGEYDNKLGFSVYEGYYLKGYLFG